MSPIEILAVLLLTLVIPGGIGLRLAQNRSATLVLQKFNIAVEPQSTPNPTVEIIGRRQGIVAFILSLLGFSPVTRFSISGPEIRCQSASLFGQRSDFIPLRCVSTMTAGVYKPVSAILFAMTFVFLGAFMSIELRSWAPIAVALVFAIICVVAYVLSKQFFIAIYPHGGPFIYLRFKPNVLEGVPIDVDQALAVVGVIRDLVFHDGSATASQGQAPTRLPLPHQDNHATHGTATPAWGPPPETHEGDAEEQAKNLMAQARQHMKSGQTQHAVTTLQEILRRFPNTQTAAQSRRSLEKSGIPT